jgi:hypothetical protein
MKKYTWQEFSDLVRSENSKNCEHCKKTAFRGWEAFSKSQESALVLLGEFQDAENYISKNGYTEYHPGGTNYWSKDAPIALAYYPYHESMVRQCNVCNAVFLTYTEYSGHAPQSRCRWVQDHLVVIPADD